MSKVKGKPVNQLWLIHGARFLHAGICKGPKMSSAFVCALSPTVCVVTKCYQLTAQSRLLQNITYF